MTVVLLSVVLSSDLVLSASLDCLSSCLEWNYTPFLYALLHPLSNSVYTALSLAKHSIRIKLTIIIISYHD